MGDRAPEGITEILHDWASGAPEALRELMPQVVAELRHGTVYIVVLTGDERGNLWYDDSANSGVVAPVLRDGDHLVEVSQLDLSQGEAVVKHFENLALSGNRVSFGDWYLDWLDKLLAATRART